VHLSGAATVAVANKKLIDEYSQKLRASGLTVSVAPDEEFEGADESEEGEEAIGGDTGSGGSNSGG
jgi:hypothetical protein